MNDKGYVFFKLWAIKLSLKNAFLERPSRTGGTPGSGGHPAPYLQLPSVGRELEEKGQHHPKPIQPSRCCHGHGNFQDDFLLTFSFLHVHAPYYPFRLLTNLGNTPETRQNTVIQTADDNSTQTNTCYC